MKNFCKFFSPCRNNGQCTNEVVDDILLFYKCICPKGFQGLRCELIDYEYDFNSNYSTIVIENGNQSTTTTILPSITSTPIPVTSHVCSNNKTICLNEGICNPTSIEPYYNCSCPSGVSGNNCENSKLF